MDKWETLKGRTLNKISSEGEDVTFHTTEGEITFSTEAECCSQSWIEHFESPSEPVKIIEFKKIPMPPSYDLPPTKTGNSEDCMEYYFYEVLTDKGSFLIEMRNSSNGYYGGYLA